MDERSKLGCMFFYYRNVDVPYVPALCIRCKPIRRELILRYEFSEVQFYTNRYTRFPNMTVNPIFLVSRAMRLCQITRDVIWNQKM
jgi:hypothetical protein